MVAGPTSFRHFERSGLLPAESTNPGSETIEKDPRSLDFGRSGLRSG
jgi:hypothetical protein